jgi:hypothetical protein
MWSFLLLRTNNHRHMKSLIIPCCIMAALFTACKKEDVAQPQTSAPLTVLTGGISQGYLTWEEFGDATGFIYTDGTGGSPYRGTFTDPVTMAWIEQDHEPIEMVTDMAPDNRLTYGIHDPGATTWWIPVWDGASGAYRVRSNEYGTEDTPTEVEDHWRWIRHQVDTQDGHPVYVFESYMYPGFFMAHYGVLTCGNCLGMNQTSVEHAARFTLR